MNSKYGWHIAETNTFWGEISQCDHVLQIYEDDKSFLDLLESYIVGGLKADECVILIATRQHLNAINDRVKNKGFNLSALTLNECYVPLVAEEMLSKFMINNWPDEDLFTHELKQLISKPIQRNQKIRAFGEMVSILWSQGQGSATIHLEHLWNRFCSEHSLTLFCAYPKSGFTNSTTESLNRICGAHARIIDGVGESSVIYKNMI
jgi:hypothetical protein